MKDIYNWALAGTGGINIRFLEGLRAANGCAYAVVSRNLQRARDFAIHYNIEKAYDNYDLMLEDPAIDVVYIGTPHTTHKDLTVRALKAQKAVLCEKPCAINAAELREMLRAAEENNSFFMEAMWTRFLPPLTQVRKWLSQKLIGDVKMIQANFGFSAAYNPMGRLYNPGLGGGALLDVGIYPLSFISMVFENQKVQAIKSHLAFGETGVDEDSVAILSYGGSRLACASASIRTSLENNAWIYGTQGRIYIPSFFSARTASLFCDSTDEYTYKPEFISNGFNYEAEEVMNCLRKGLVESAVMPWNESLAIMETMDEIRSQWNFRYPQEG